MPATRVASATPRAAAEGGEAPEETAASVEEPAE